LLKGEATDGDGGGRTSPTAETHRKGDIAFRSKGLLMMDNQERTTHGGEEKRGGEKGGRGCES